MKKTESITYRTDPETKEILVQAAAEKMWSLSQLTEVIVKDWVAAYLEQQDRPK